MTFFNDQQTNLSRRTLLKGLGACAALPLLAGLFPKSALAKAVSTALEQFPTLVPAQKGILTGAHWGAFEAIVSEGRMVRVQPVADDPAPNDLIDMAPFQVHAKNRIKYPMVRKSWLEHGPGARPELRGADEWVRVSWEKAIDLVAGEIQRVQSDFGPQAIHAGSYGWKSVGMFHNSRTLLHRLMNLSGGFTGYAGDYSTGAAQVIMSHVMGSIEVYEQQTAWPNVVEHAELVVLWGVNAQVTLKNSWNMPDHEGQAGFKALKEKGTRVISIDPVYNETAKLVGAEWIAPNAYTDVAMMLGVAHTLYSEKKHDQAFLDRYTVGFDTFLAYLLGKEDGQPKSAEWASSRLRRRCQGDPPAGPRHGRQAHHDHGRLGHAASAPRGAAQLDAGHSGRHAGPDRPAGGRLRLQLPLLLRWQPHRQGRHSGGHLRRQRTEEQPGPHPGGPHRRLPRQPGQDHRLQRPQGDLSGHQAGLRGGRQPLPPPSGHQQPAQGVAQAADRDRARALLDGDRQARRHRAAGHHQLRAQRPGDGGRLLPALRLPHAPVRPPQFEARNDFDIFSAIAAKLGVQEQYTEGKDEMLWLKQMYDGMAAQARGARVALPPFNMFWESNNYIRFPIPEANRQWIRHADFRENPLLNPLGTPSGKIEIFSNTVAGMGYADCAGHPKWYEPKEWVKSEVAARYPLSLNTSHPTQRLHSQLDNTPLRDKFAIADRRGDPDPS